MPTIRWREDLPTVEALTIGRLEPPVTLQPGQFLGVISSTEAAVFDGDCQVGERSRIVSPLAVDTSMGVYLDRHGGHRE